MESQETCTERLYVKVPGTQTLRKRAEGHLRHLVATGWHETGRAVSLHYVDVRLNRARTHIAPPRTNADASSGRGSPRIR
jgi:hypothetical protein